MSVVLTKIAAGDKKEDKDPLFTPANVAGAAVGAGLGGVGGYQLGKYLKAGQATKALITAAGALAGGYGGYHLASSDPEKLNRPWYIKNRRGLMQTAGAGLGAGLGLVGAKAFGADDPTSTVGAAVLMGGLGALGGDIAHDELFKEFDDRMVNKAHAGGFTWKNKDDWKANEAETVKDMKGGMGSWILGGTTTAGAATLNPVTLSKARRLAQAERITKALRQSAGANGQPIAMTSKELADTTRGVYRLIAGSEQTSVPSAISRIFGKGVTPANEAATLAQLQTELNKAKVNPKAVTAFFEGLRARGNAHRITKPFRIIPELVNEMSKTKLGQMWRASQKVRPALKKVPVIKSFVP